MSAPKDTSYTFRLFPGADLRNSFQSFVKEGNIQAGWIVSCAGSLTGYSIRFANQPGATKDTGHFEIVSLTGTVSVNGSHLYISIRIVREKLLEVILWKAVKFILQPKLSWLNPGIIYSGEKEMEALHGKNYRL